MNKIKKMKYLKIITVLLICTQLFAQDAKKAKNLLDEVSAKVKSYENITIDFKYSISNPKENIFQESKGNVILKSDMYLLNFMGIIKMFDGKLTYTIVPEDEEITISKFDEDDENAITPSKMLTFFNSGFTYKWDIPQEIKGRKIQYIKLTPISNKDTRKEILLGIDVQTKHIYNLIEIDKKGTRTTLIVNSFKTNQPLSKNQFTFVQDKYPNYYINRLD